MADKNLEHFELAELAELAALAALVNKEASENDQDTLSNKCDQYISSQADNLRRHFKANSEEQSNKCNQCDYASSREDDLRTHLIKYSGEKTNKCN